MSAEFVQIGWIAHDMTKRRTDGYKAMFGKGSVRVPPKIYTSEKVAARYGTPIPVFTKSEHQPPTS